jgi:hypothetical protein
MGVVIMSGPLVIVVILITAVVAFALARYVRALLRNRGTRLVACPETSEAAAVKVNALRAALSALRGRTRVHLSECSRWPERAGCGQECLSAIRAAPDGCLIRSMLVRWYEGKTCTLCGSEVDAIHWYTHEPAFLDSNGQTLEWKDIPALDLPKVLDTHRPVCWNCHIIESVIREHPDRVVFRP